jgi:hypothetical protein
MLTGTLTVGSDTIGVTYSGGYGLGSSILSFGAGTPRVTASPESARYTS